MRMNVKTDLPFDYSTLCDECGEVKEEAVLFDHVGGTDADGEDAACAAILCLDCLQQAVRLILNRRDVAAAAKEAGLK